MGNWGASEAIGGDCPQRPRNSAASVRGMSSPLRSVVLIRTQPGMRDRQLGAFAELAPVVRAEDGCLQYDLHETSEPDRFVLLERWESHEALAVHNASAHMATADAANGAFRAGPAEVLLLADDSSA